VLSAVDEIANLIYTYDEHVDRGRFGDAAALFADATVRYPSRDVTVTGADELEAFLRRSDRVYDDGTPRTLRYRTNVTVDVDDGGGVATAFSFFTLVQAAPAFPLQLILAGATHDRFVLVDGIWRFDDRRVDVRLTVDLSAHTPETTS
jgi:SnoaL-like domain